MKILGIDYGKSKIGLATSEGKLASPWKVIRNLNAIAEIKSIIEKEKFDEVVVGVSEREMGEESKKFAEVLGAKTFDETLSTYDAQRLSIESGMKRKKRKEMEDAFAACVMLQSYLDQNV